MSIKVELMLPQENSPYPSFISVGEASIKVSESTLYGTIILDGKRIPIRLTTEIEHE